MPTIFEFLNESTYTSIKNRCKQQQKKVIKNIQQI